MRIIGYGEDGLTYWALGTQLQHILQKLNDDTPPGQCTAFFRPSFGRAGGPESAQFGEFDAILATSKAIYLIEAKWDNVTDNCKPIVLREVQILRHRILKWLLTEWRQLPQPRNWNAFCQASQAKFTQDFPNRPLAPLGSLLARNLSYIIGLLGESSLPTHNLLLFFHRRNGLPPQRVVNAAGKRLDEFTVVSLAYAAFGDTGYFQILDETPVW